MTPAPDAVNVGPGLGLVRDRRRPFFYQTHDALDLIRERFTGPRERSTAIALYVCLTEAANLYGGEAARDGFEVTRRDLAANAGVSVDTFDRYARAFTELGLLDVERRKVGNVNLPNRWVLLDPPGPQVYGQGGRRSAALRARSSSRVKETEEGGTSSPQDEGGAGGPPDIVLVDGQNVALNELCDACGIDRASPRLAQAVVALNGRVPKAGELPEPGIRHLAWQEVERWAEAGAMPDRLDELREDPAAWMVGLATMIRRKAARYRVTMPGAMLTPKALRDWWLDLERQGAGDGGLSAEEIERFGT